MLHHEMQAIIGGRLHTERYRASPLEEALAMLNACPSYALAVETRDGRMIGARRVDFAGWEGTYETSIHCSRKAYGRPDPSFALAQNLSRTDRRGSFTRDERLELRKGDLHVILEGSQARGYVGQERLPVELGAAVLKRAA